MLHKIPPNWFLSFFLFQICEKARRAREEEARLEQHRQMLAERNQRALDRALAPPFVKVMASFAPIDI
jgi:hypothetical protein